MHWLPTLGFVVLAVVFLYKALFRSAARTWSWGRGGGAAPLSRIAYGVWSTTFFCIAWVLTQMPQLPLLAGPALLACLIAIIAAGIADNRAQHRPEKPER